MIRIIFFILFNIVLIAAQVVITQSKQWKYGLIIPIFNSVLALVIALFTTTATITTTRFIGGVRLINSSLRVGGFIWSFSWMLMLLSIPAIINLILYLFAQNRAKRQEAENLVKMKINEQD